MTVIFWFSVGRVGMEGVGGGGGGGGGVVRDCNICQNYGKLTIYFLKSVGKLWKVEHITIYYVV